MIAKLKGIVDSVDTDSAVVDVGGVGYLVSASSRTLRDLVAGLCEEIGRGHPDDSASQHEGPHGYTSSR